MAHLHAEPILQIDGREILRLVKSAYKVKPSTIAVTPESKSSVVMHLRVLARIDPKIVEQLKKFDGKYACAR